MPIFHVVAMSKNRVIGKDNQLPWHFPSDLKYFKQLTTGSAVIMGRKTFDSIFERLKKPLPERMNIVLTKQAATASFENLRYVNSIQDALKTGQTANVFIIGGATIFEQTLNLVDGIYLTHIDREYEGDAFYPDLPSHFVEEKRVLLQDNPKIEAIFYRKKR